MKIALLGTRGIPNNYGGFEEFAEQVSKFWTDSGHEVFVYCEISDKKVKIDNLKIKQVYVRGSSLKIIGQFIYDFLSTKHAISNSCDIYYHAGYATSVLGNILLRKELKGKLIYNMDGLEWKRSKFNCLTRILTKILERLSSKTADALVSDNIGIKEHLHREYQVNSELIEYGALVPEILDNNNFNEKYNYQYDLIIARFEPENHIEEIINAYAKSNRALVLVANRNTKLHDKLINKISNLSNIIFNGPIYEKNELNYLRQNCNYYVHGHSVGGTNPSLLEALISGCRILAHNNIFNNDVVNDFGYYWSDSEELIKLINYDDLSWKNSQKQVEYTKERFNWEKIANQHIDLFKKILTQSIFK